MKKIVFQAFFLFLTAQLVAQGIERPKLVVGIDVDQMRYDYLTRYWSEFGEEGFKRLVQDGFSCRNLHYNYSATYTGPGHASIYTGTTPRYHGVIANNWYDRQTGRKVYCTQDLSVRSVGVNGPSGQMSPTNMLTTTVCDELKLNTAGRSKVIGISIKDRGAILTAGHSADFAFWMTDRWITSSHYVDSLPDWVSAFNTELDTYYPDVWDPLKELREYDESWPDDNQFESIFIGTEHPVFPYDLKRLMADNGGIGMIKSTPFGNTITAEFAKAAILNEQLGQDPHTDFLTISFSSPDYIGHMFGPQSVEVQDNYLRLDLEIASFLHFLDEHVGTGEYLIFLTADHGGAWVPSHMETLGIPNGHIDGEFLYKASQAYILEHYGSADFILNYSNDQFYLDKELILLNGQNPDEVASALADFVLNLEGVAETFTARQLVQGDFTEGTSSRIKNGFNLQRSGDVVVVFQPGWTGYGITGTTHGSPYSYDTHVPALFFGWGVKPGYTDKRLAITDIAPTVCAMLQIEFPSACTGEPIRQITERANH